MSFTPANSPLKVNGTYIKAPLTCQVTISDMDASTSGRDQSGLMHRDRVAIKRKVNCTWGELSSAEMSALLTAVSGVSFTLQYPDPQTGTLKSGTFYVGDRTPPITIWNNVEQDYRWKSLSMNFVEF